MGSPPEQSVVRCNVLKAKVRPFPNSKRPTSLNRKYFVTVKNVRQSKASLHKSRLNRGACLPFLNETPLQQAGLYVFT